MNLKFNVLPYQKEVIQHKSNCIFLGGYGSSKSYTATIKTIVKKLRYPNERVAYYLPDYGLVRDIAFDKFPSMLEDIGLGYKLNKADKEIHIWNTVQDFGSIIFRNMSQPEGIVGYEVAYSAIDEADILPEHKMDVAYKKILARN